MFDRCLIDVQRPDILDFREAMARTLDRTEPKDILNRCERIGLERAVLAASLGVSLKTIQRWREGGRRPNEAGLRGLEKLEEICRIAARVLRKDRAAEWFHSPNESLAGERPLDWLRRGELDRVRNVLGMLEWGIYS